MEPLARLPVFFALEGKRAVVAGGTPAAAWKAELLSAAGAQVDVYAPDAVRRAAGARRRSAARRDHRSIAAPGRGRRSRRRRHRDRRLRQRRRGGALSPPPRARAGVPVNVIDKPAFCDFSFGAIVNRSPLVIGISTDGAAPVFAQAIRAKLEALIPRGFARWAEAARRWRASAARRPACRSTAAGGSGSSSPRMRLRDPERRAADSRLRRAARRACAGRRRKRRAAARSRWSAPARAIPNC